MNGLRNAHTLWWRQVNSLPQRGFRGSVLHIVLSTLKVICGYHSKEYPECIIPDSWCKGLVVVFTVDLRDPLDTSLALNRSSDSSGFVLVVKNHLVETRLDP